MKSHPYSHTSNGQLVLTCSKLLTSINKNVIYSLLILTSGLASPTSTQAVTFTKLVDSLDQVPGSATGEKFKLGQEALNGNIVAFEDYGRKTLWSMDATRGLPSLIKLVDTNTAMPQGTGSFKSLSLEKSGDLVIFKDNGNRNFMGSSPDSIQTGLYAVPAKGGNITMLINQSSLKGLLKSNLSSPTAIGSGLGDSLPFFSISINDNLTRAVLAPDLSESSVYPENIYRIDAVLGSTSPLFKAKDSVCDTPASVMNFDAGEDTAVFELMIGKPTVLSQQQVIYSARENVVAAGSFTTLNDFNPSCLKPFTGHGNTVVASGQTIVPGTEPNPITFASDKAIFGAPIIEGDTVVFAGAAKPISTAGVGNTLFDHVGLYSLTLSQGNKLLKLADTKTPIPGGTGNFAGIGHYTGGSEAVNIPYYSISGNKVAFMGKDAAGKMGLYWVTASGESLTKIIAAGDTLGDGRVVKDVSINQDALQGDRLLFTVAFGGKETGSGIYLATISTNGMPDAKNCLLNWAEATYPGLYSPAGANTQFNPPYTYRYYKSTNRYLGISTTDNHVYSLNADNALRDEGDLEGWLDTAKKQSCFVNRCVRHGK